MKLGTIGYGLMGSAILKGLVRSNTLTPGDILVAGRTEKTRNRASSDGFPVTESNADAAACDVVLLAVPPWMHDQVCEEIQAAVAANHTVIWTIAAGVTIERVSEILGTSAEIVRTMPNICATVGSSVTAAAFGPAVTPDTKARLTRLLNGFGSSIELDESMLDRVVPVTGSSPAMLFMVLDAMMNAAAMQGFSWDDALRLSAETMKGCAEMVLQSGEHPAKLQNQVCTPGGITLDLVKKLEEDGLRNAVLEGMEACVRKE